MNTGITIIGIITFAVMISAAISSDAIALEDEASSKDLESSYEQQCNWEKSLLAEHPHSRNVLCYLQYCEEPITTVKERTQALIVEQKMTLENDYIVQQFLRKHPEVTLDDVPLNIVNNQRPITWMITTLQDSESAKETKDFRHNLDSSKTTKLGKLFVNFDQCGYITEYSYDVTNRDDDSIRAKYPYDDYNLKKVAKFDEERYHIAKTIMGIHTSPRVQINEFNISSDKIQCNEGWALVAKYDGSPACVKSESVLRLDERGWTNTQNVTKVNSAENNILRYSPVLFKGSGVILDKNEFTAEDFQQMQQRKTELEVLLGDRSISEEIREDMKNEQSMIQYYSQQAFDENVPFDLITILWEKRMQFREFLSTQTRDSVFPIACTGGISVGFNAYSVDEKYVGNPIALIISVPEEHFIKLNLQKADEIIREHVGEEIDVVYNKSDCYAVPLG